MAAESLFSFIRRWLRGHFVTSESSLAEAFDRGVEVGAIGSDQMYHRGFDKGYDTAWRDMLSKLADVPDPWFSRIKHGSGKR